MKQLIICGMLMFTLSGCNLSRNGRYIVYSVIEQYRNNDTVLNHLKYNLQGQRYNLVFYKEYVSLKSLKTSHELQLPLEKVHTKVPTYHNSYTENGSTYDITLYKDTSIYMDVDLSIEQTNRIKYEGPIGFGPVYNDKEARVRCMLAKSEQ